jgi:hypothetical protein
MEGYTQGSYIFFEVPVSHFGMDSSSPGQCQENPQSLFVVFVLLLFHSVLVIVLVAGTGPTKSCEAYHPECQHKLAQLPKEAKARTISCLVLDMRFS